MKALTIETLATPRRVFDREQDTNAKERIRPRRRGGTPGARAALKLIGTLHGALYRWSAGRLGGRLRGGPVLLLTTTGRTTGQERTWPISYLSLGDEVVLIASAHGSPSQPAWYRNLLAHPFVRVQQGGTIRTMTSRIAQGTERARLWERVVKQYPVAAAYQHNAGRELPVVLLRPVDGEAATERSRRAA
jgi:deazaflavin-dependent oxidoreductase (nitroreductase family)